MTWASGSTGWGRSRGARASVCSVTRGSTGPPSVGAGRVPRGHVRDGLHGERRRRSRLGAAEPRAVTRVTAGAPTGLVGCDAAQGRGALTSPRCARRGQNRHVPRCSSARRGRIPEPVPVPSRQPPPRPRFCSGPSSWTQATCPARRGAAGTESPLCSPTTPEAPERPPLPPGGGVGGGVLGRASAALRAGRRRGALAPSVFGVPAFQRLLRGLRTPEARDLTSVPSSLDRTEVGSQDATWGSPRAPAPPRAPAAGPLPACGTFPACGPPRHAAT